MTTQNAELIIEEQAIAEVQNHPKQSFLAKLKRFGYFLISVISGYLYYRIWTNTKTERTQKIIYSVYYGLFLFIVILGIILSALGWTEVISYEGSHFTK